MLTWVLCGVLALGPPPSRGAQRPQRYVWVVVLTEPWDCPGVTRQSLLHDGMEFLFEADARRAAEAWRVAQRELHPRDWRRYKAAPLRVEVTP